MSRPLPQITWLLSIGFTSIAALNLVALMVAYVSYSAFRADQSEFASQTLPVAGRARTVAIRSSYLLRLSGDITTQTTPGQLDELESQISRQIEIIREDFDLGSSFDAANSKTGDLPTVSALKLTPEVDEALSALMDGVSAQREILANELAQGARIDSVGSQIEDLRLTLTTLAASRASDPLERETWQELISAIGPWEARYLLLKGRPPTATIDSLSAELQAEVRAASLVVSRLPASEARQTVSQILLPILKSGSGTNGAFEVSKRLEAQRLVLDEKLSSTGSVLVEFSNKLGEVSEQMRGTIAASVNDLALTTRNMERLLAGLCVLSLAAGVIFVRRFVLQGVGQPLTRLAEKTHQLAEGDFNIEPSKATIREFDLIEKALTVFAKNSTELRSTRDELAGKNLSLQQSLEDLERFSYAASHDLRSPLRGIDTLATFIRDDLGDEAPPEVRRNLDRMRKRIESLEQLLEDLLAYSRAGDIDPEFLEIDLATLIHSAVDILDVHSRVSVSLALEVKSVSAPEALISQVIRNIVDNAIKHHPNAKLPPGDRFSEPDAIHLTIRSKRQHSHTTIEVSDDGLGVPERYLPQVVRLFGTLQKKSHSGGSGLGLPLVRRLLRQYGGDIELSAREDGRPGLTVAIFWPDTAKRHSDSLLQGVARPLGSAGAG